MRSLYQKFPKTDTLIIILYTLDYTYRAEGPDGPWNFSVVKWKPPLLVVGNDFQNNYLHSGINRFL